LTPEEESVARPRKVTVYLAAEELAHLRKLAQRDRISLSAVLRMAARDATGNPPQAGARQSSFDESYDHALQQELILLNLIATEQALLALEAMNPYTGDAEDGPVRAAQAAQRRIARGIPDALGGQPDAAG